MSFDIDFAKKVIDQCYSLYSKVSVRKNKVLAQNEWTNMACIIKTVGGNEDIEIVSLATGTKCVGESQRVDSGRLLNDSHAEVLARRLFLKFLYKQIKLAVIDSITTPTTTMSENQSIFYINKDHNTSTRKVCLKNDVNFHLFTTEIPCGDASIFPKTQSINLCGQQDNDNLKPRKRKSSNTISSATQRSLDITKLRRISDANDGCDSIGASRVKIQEDDELRFEKEEDRTITENKDSQLIEKDGSLLNKDRQSETSQRPKNNKKEKAAGKDDIFRTGAKCVPDGPQDSLRSGIEYHTTGPLRIKPGRGFRTISMSCSDKMMKWCTLGLQGGLLANLVAGDGVCLSTVTVASPYFDEVAFQRALSFRERSEEENIEERQLKQPKQLQHRLECNALKPRDVQVFYIGDRPFIDSKEIVQQRISGRNGINQKLTSSGVAILWCASCNIHEFSSNGWKHGVVKKLLNTEKSCTSICKQKLFEDFLEILNGNQLGEKSDSGDGVKTYHDFKRMDFRYRCQRHRFFTLFDDWIRKPIHHEQFTLPS